MSGRLSRQPRFYAPDLSSAVDRVVLSADESVHLARVLRLAPGDEALVFDGRGLQYRAVVESTSRDRAVMRLIAPETAAREAAVAVTLAIAALKGDKLDAVVRDATMLGVTAIQPLVTARAEINRRALAHAARLTRWRAVAIASVKQCGRAALPELHAPATLEEALARLDGRGVLLVEPGTDRGGPSGLVELQAQPPPTRAVLFVGPEGGWSDDERALALRHGCIPLTLGPWTLRADAAPIVALSVLRYVWNDL